MSANHGSGRTGHGHQLRQKPTPAARQHHHRPQSRIMQCLNYFTVHCHSKKRSPGSGTELQPRNTRITRSSKAATQRNLPWGTEPTEENFVGLRLRSYGFFVVFVVQFLRLDLDALVDFYVSGLFVADRQSWQLPRLRESVQSEIPLRFLLLKNPLR